MAASPTPLTPSSVSTRASTGWRPPTETRYTCTSVIFLAVFPLPAEEGGPAIAPTAAGPIALAAASRVRNPRRFIAPSPLARAPSPGPRSWNPCETRQADELSGPFCHRILVEGRMIRKKISDAHVRETARGPLLG